MFFLRGPMHVNREYIFGAKAKKGTLVGLAESYLSLQRTDILTFYCLKLATSEKIFLIIVFYFNIIGSSIL